MRKKKVKSNRLKAPSTFRRVWKVCAYNIFWSFVFFYIFFKYYSLDAVAYELDYFMFYGFKDLRIELFSTCIAFWFAFRQFFKDCNLIRFTHRMRSDEKKIIESGGYKRMYEGAEGLGKTLNTAYETLLIACVNDADMRFRYFLDYPYREELKDDEDFKVLESSFNYFESHPDKIPHLMANFYIEYDGKREYPFTMDYFDKKKRPAEGFACGLTEIGNDLPNSESRISKKDESEFNAKTKQEVLSVLRQLYLMTIVADEQRTGEVFLGFRALVTSNNKITERIKVLKPAFLMSVLNFVKGLINLFGKKNKKFLSVTYRKLFDVVQDIGFYVFVLVERDGEKGTVLNTSERVMSCDLPFKFDTRGERKKHLDMYLRSPE